MANVETTAESNLITTSQMTKVREIDFVEKFTGSVLKKLTEALGVSRKIPMAEGTSLYVYKTTGTLQSGSVDEGNIIPLSQYARTKTLVGEISLKKWRKATTAEAIKKSGYDEAVAETDRKLLSDVQKSVRSDFFTFLTGLDGTGVGGSTFQMVCAKAWGKLQVLFEDDAVEAVYFVNPETISDYLGAANITIQTAFGLNYISDFLGLGTVVMSSLIPVGQVYATAKENLICYYLNMGGDIAGAFGLRADETGLIGIRADIPNTERAQIETLVMSGITFLVEYASGVVVGIIDSTPGLGTITVTSTQGTASGDSNIAVSNYTPGAGESYVYKCGSTAPTVTYGQKLGSGWTAIVPPHDITPGSATKITVASVDANNRAQAAGSQTITKKP